MKVHNANANGSDCITCCTLYGTSNGNGTGNGAMVLWVRVCVVYLYVSNVWGVSMKRGRKEGRKEG